jgi:EmrB/QacA subfamily drug resistance transporter
MEDGDDTAGKSSDLDGSRPSQGTRPGRAVRSASDADRRHRHPERGAAVDPRRSRGADGQLQLASVAYTVTFGSLLIIAGRAGDLFGRRRFFIIGLAVFTAASLLTGMAQAPWQLFASRALQGLGAAMVSPTALALLTSTHDEGAARNRAMALWAAVGSGGAIAGQLAGGVITDVFGWRWIFLINVPIGLVAIAIATRLFPESRDDDQRRHLDLAGAGLLAAAIAVASLGLARVGEHGLDRITVGHLVVSVVLLTAFGRQERRHPVPLVRLGLLRLPGVSTGNSVLALLAGSTAGALFFATLYLQVVLDYSPADVGFAFAPVTLIVLAVSPLAGRIVTGVGVRPPLVAGTAFCAIGFVYLAGVDPGGSYLVDVLPGLGLVALGNGLAFAPTMITATSGVAEDEQGVASGLMNTAQELGTALGLAALAAVAVGSVTAADGDALATVDGYQVGFLAAAALAVVGLTCAWRAPRHLGRSVPTPDSPEPVPTH